jgi:hypothetical protein
MGKKNQNEVDSWYSGSLEEKIGCIASPHQPSWPAQNPKNLVEALAKLFKKYRSEVLSME